MTQSGTNIIMQQGSYALIVAEGTFREDFIGKTVYQVVHVPHGVVQAEGPFFPQAKAIFDDLVAYEENGNQPVMPLTPDFGITH